MALPDPAVTETAQAALSAVRDDWMRRSGVVSIEVARRRHNGVPTDDVGIRVTVERILPREQVPAGELFPDEVDGVPVDLVEGRRPGLESI